jgi:hypothetical protein
MTTYANTAILAPGKYTAMDGLPVGFSEADLLAIEAELAARETNGSAALRGGVPLNLEHQRATEKPGHACNIRYDPLRRQLLADLHVRDPALDEALRQGRYQSRSAELVIDANANSPPRLSGLALLDELAPAVKGLGGLSLSPGGAGHRAHHPPGGAAVPGGLTPPRSAALPDAATVGRATEQITRDALRDARDISMYGGNE